LREWADAGTSPSADSHATSSANGRAASCAVPIPALTVVPLLVPTAVPFHAHANCRTTSGADGRGDAGPDCRLFQYQRPSCLLRRRMPPPVPTAVPLPAPCRACAEGRAATNADQRPSCLLRRCLCLFHCQPVSSSPEEVALCSSRALREGADAGASPSADSHATSSANGCAASCAVPVPALTVVPLLVPTAVLFHAHPDCRTTSGADGRCGAGPDCRHFQYQRPSYLMRRCSCHFQGQPLSSTPEKVAMCSSRALRE
jgi:hypothetical protein